MKIDCISDLHGHFPELEDGDLLIVAGDLTARDNKDEYIKFFHWIQDQLYKKIIFISGNHDNWMKDNQKEWICKTDDIDIIYLCDSGTEFEGLKIWGAPWSTTFLGMNPHCKAFTCDTEEELAKKWALIPDDIDILITHSPPYGILDQIETGYTGSLRLLEALENRIKPKIHVFGHIHEHGGKQLIYKRPGYGDENNTICVNASIVNEHYQHVNKPVRIVL